MRGPVERLLKTSGQTATITRPVGDSVDSDTGFTNYGTETVAEDAVCRFDDASTSFVREDTGERVQRPATVTFLSGTDVQEGDNVDIDGVSQTYEVRGVNVQRGHRDADTLAIQCELERAD